MNKPEKQPQASPRTAPETEPELNRTAKVMLSGFTPDHVPPKPRSILTLLHQLKKRTET